MLRQPAVNNYNYVSQETMIVLYKVHAVMARLTQLEVSYKSVATNTSYNYFMELTFQKGLQFRFLSGSMRQFGYTAMDRQYENTSFHLQQHKRLCVQQ